MTNVVRVSDSLVREAKIYSKIDKRSVTGQIEKDNSIVELKAAPAKVKTLSGLLPIGTFWALPLGPMQKSTRALVGPLSKNKEEYA